MLLRDHLQQQEHNILPGAPLGELEKFIPLGLADCHHGNLGNTEPGHQGHRDEVSLQISKYGGGWERKNLTVPLASHPAMLGSK